MKLRKMYRNILICIIIIFSIIASVTIANASNFNTLRNRVEQAITKIEQVKSSNNILNKILNEISDEIAEDGSDPEENGETDPEKDGESEDESGQTPGDVDEENTETPDDKTYNVQMELNIVDESDNEIIGDNKLNVKEKISEEEANQEDSLDIQIFNLSTGEELEKNEEDGSVLVQNNGLLVDFNNLKKEKEYNIEIDNIEVAEGYNKIINKLILKLLIDKDENIVAEVVEATNESGDNVLDQLSGILHGADGDGKLTIEPESQNSDIKIKYKKENDPDWQEYTDKVKIYENTTISAKASKDGKESGITLKVIDNIDNQEPNLSDFNEKNGETEREVVVTAKLTDDKSGIVKYGISRSKETEPETIIKADDDLTDEDIEEHRNSSPVLDLNVEIRDIYENGDFFIWIWDTAGNCAKKEVKITKVKVQQVAQIVETSDKSHSNLEGKTYPTLREALEASPEGANTTIKLLADIYNESNEITGKNITINLSGFTLGSKSNRNPTLIVNKGHELTIINKQEDGKTQSKGLLSSECKHAIEVKDGAKLTLRRI